MFIPEDKVAVTRPIKAPFELFSSISNEYRVFVKLTLGAELDGLNIRIETKAFSIGFRPPPSWHAISKWKESRGRCDMSLVSLTIPEKNEGASLKYYTH